MAIVDGVKCRLHGNSRARRDLDAASPRRVRLQSISGGERRAPKICV